jgi:outer membrane immunogenic protein
LAVTLAAAVVGASGGAAADEFRNKASSPALSYRWTGLYLGANAGYGWARSETLEDCQDCTDPISQLGTFKIKGFIGGGQLGFNYQINSLVLGAEADMNYANAETSGIALVNGYVQDIRYHWLSTVRGRMGYAADRTLFYVTGGAAFANIYHASFDGEGARESTTRSGWTFGGGIEHALADHWSIKLEYLYADFGTTVLHGTFNPPRPIYFDYQDRMHMVRVGVNYRFGGL